MIYASRHIVFIKEVVHLRTTNINWNGDTGGAKDIYTRQMSMGKQIRLEKGTASKWSRTLLVTQRLGPFENLVLKLCRGLAS